jgi:hypothetical protein
MAGQICGARNKSWALEEANNFPFPSCHVEVSFSHVSSSPILLGVWWAISGAFCGAHTHVSFHFSSLHI